MFKKILSGYFSRLSEGRILLEDLFRKRSARKGIPRLSDGELFSYLKLDDDDLKAIKDAYRERDFSLAKKELVAYLRKRNYPRFFFSYGDSEKLRKVLKEFSHSYRHTTEAADRVCSHVITVPTGLTGTFGTFIDWFSDFNGKSWSYCHVSDLGKKLQDRHVQKMYDLGYLPTTLEFNKHHHLVDLGRAYFLTHDEKYAQEFIIELEDWIEKNPPNWGVNWLDPLMVAQRVISWLFALGLFLPSPHLSGDAFCTVLKSLFFHGTYLVEQCSDKTLKPAKLIGVASALYFLASLFPEFESLRSWKDRALKVLEHEAQAQFSSDGIHRERSLGLQCLLTEFLMLPLLLDRLNSQRTSSIIRSHVELSLEFLMYTIQPGGRSLIFGETPITRVWHFGGTAHEDYKNLLCLGAVLFERGDMKSIAGEFYEDVLWFFHTEGYRTYDNVLSRPPEESSRAFPEGGYLTFRDSWEKDSTFCFFYGNPRKKFANLDKGMEGLPLHRDVLSFALSVRGEPFIIETGSYRGKKKFSTYFSRSQAHNVIVIDGKEQSLSRTFKGSKKSLQLVKTKWAFKEDCAYVMSGNAGFDDLKSLVVHRREMLYLRDKRWFLIKDTLEGADEFLVELNFHFAPELEIILRGDYGCFIRGRKDFVRLNPYFPGDFSCSLNRGKLEPLSGWYAKDCTRVEPCYRLEYYARLRLPSEIFTWVSWARGEFRIPHRDELAELFHAVGDLKDVKETELLLEALEKER
ncbi:MAG: alginate lyase family protein [Candidatus Eremiobacteraeota bacterium]|nr:alginate lyase family protein [Candidatus Eremiobacteraeota bacterium]